MYKAVCAVQGCAHSWLPALPPSLVLLLIGLHAEKSRSHPSCADGLAWNLTWEMFQISPSSSLGLEELGCNTELFSVLALMEPVLLQ